MPESIQQRYVCNPDGELISVTTFPDTDGIYIAEVGRCVGTMKIIGYERGTGT